MATENRYITDNPPENRMVDGDPLPENRPITRESAVSAVLKEFPELSETLKEGKGIAPRVCVMPLSIFPSIIHLRTGGLTVVSCPLVSHSEVTR